MSSGSPLIARIRLARSPVRLYAVPAVVLAAALALAALALLNPAGIVDPAGIAMLAGAAMLVLIAALLALRPATLRLDVEEAAVRIHWLGGERRYVLAPGPVTRVRLRGENASSLRPHRRWRTWQLGAARLRDEEEIEVVRLAATATVILVPTEHGRLAIAAASEGELIDALSQAAQARQRAEGDQPDEVAEPSPEPAPEPVAERAAGPEDAPHVLTGIERARLEERLARERAAAGAPPADHQAAGERAGSVDSAAEAVPAQAEPAPPIPVPATAEAEKRPRWWPRRREGRDAVRASLRLGRPAPSVALVLLPLVGTVAVWGAASALGRLPEPASDLGRLTALGLVLAGPATSIGAIMARTWWPRLVGVVVTSGLAAATFIGRALLGA